MRKRLWQTGIAALAISAGLVAAGHPVMAAEKKEPIDLDTITEALTIDFSTLQVQPLAGWYTETVSEGRTIKVYIPEDTGLRGRFNVIAVPDGVDSWDFLEKEGWIAKAEETKEALFILEPGAEGWGSVEEEKSYVAAGMSVLTSQANHNKVSIFNTFGTFAAVGYDKGCAPLEAWIVDHPLHIYSQVYFNGESAGEEAYQAAREYVYDENFPGSRRITADQFSLAMSQMGYTVEDAGTKADVAIPTWFVGYEKDAPSVAYWMSANDCVESPDMAGVFHQSIDSDCWQTLYANSNIKNWDPKTSYGISEVHITEEASIDEVYDFISSYTNYTTLCSYSNNLATRMKYYDVVNEAVEETKTGVKSSVSYTNFDGEEAQADIFSNLHSMRVSYDRCGVEGTMYAGSIATDDQDKNGEQDPREFLIYVPDSAARYGKGGAPLVLVNPGSLQTAVTFMDCCGWVPVANDEGCILLVINQPYASATSVRYTQASLDYTLKDDPETANFSRGLMSFMKNVFAGTYADIDFTRVYASGHSAGSNASEQLALVSDSDWIAAVGSTSFITRTEVMSEGYMPTYLMVGHTDINDYRVDMVSEPYVSKPTVEGAGSLYTWLNLTLAKNKIGVQIAPDDAEAYKASCTKIEDQSRFVTYTWANDQGIELVKFGRTSLREHNCYPEEFRKAWEYMEHFNVVENADGSVSRYYSASAFAMDDLVEIGAKKVAQKQTITAIASCTKAYGSKAFYLKAKTSGDGKLTYTSDNPAVATVSSKGKVTLKGIGKAVITIKASATENFKAASKKVTIKVVPAQAKLSKVKSSKKGTLDVTVKNDKIATGYQILYSTSKKFTSAVSVTVKGGNSRQIKNLKSKKTYYVKARTYTTVNGKKIYGAYSEVKKVTVK